jgi:HD-GYP domain-containing protein (c-di-GMP phosphodiesterase class II)
MGLEESLQIVKQDSGKHFDPECVVAFTAILDEVKQISEQFREKSES